MLTVVAIMRSCRCLPHVCLRCARRRAAPFVSPTLAHSRTMSPPTCSRHACDTQSPRLIDTGDGEPDGANACSA